MQNISRAYNIDEDHIHQLNILEINNLEGIKHCVIHNLGVSIISRQAVQNELTLGLMKEVKLTDMQFIRGINYIHNKAKILSPATHNFLQLLHQLK